tara:strand:+ start:92 stop:451 length:360 start_codon:yes stop_codon:yes gene_type:complete
MTTTKKIKLRFTKKKQNFKLEESKPKFRPLRKEGFGPDMGGHRDVGAGEASAQNPFVEAAQAIIDRLEDEGGTIPLEVLASAIAELPSMDALDKLFGVQADERRGAGYDPHMVGGPDPV